MTPETIKTTFTYLIALVVILGGGALLVIPTQLDSAALLPFLTGVIGTVLGYVFGERAVAQAAASQPSYTVSAGPPPTVEVTPAGANPPDPPAGPVNG